MFWKKRTTHKFPLIIFGITALFIIFFTVFLIFDLYQNFKNSNLNKSEFVEIRSNLVKEKYFFEMSNLKNSFNEDLDIITLISTAKNSFLSVKVPTEMKDAHLTAFLDLLKIEDNKNVMTEVEVLGELNILLDSILIWETK